MRFGDRLEIRTTVAEAALDGMVPSFLLQPVLENAVKFGVERRSGTGHIELSAERRRERLHIEVRDNGIPVELEEQQSRFGIGLRNSRARLAHLYGDAYMLDLIPNEIGGTTVLIEVPWTTAPAPLREAGAPA